MVFVASVIYLCLCVHQDKPPTSRSSLLTCLFDPIWKGYQFYVMLDDSICYALLLT